VVLEEATMSDWQRDSGYSAEAHDRWVTGNYGEDQLERGEEDTTMPRKAKAPSQRHARYQALLLASQGIDALALSLDADREGLDDEDPDRTHPRITEALRNIASRLGDQAWKLRD
jgi:hypothetical protein